MQFLLKEHWLWPCLFPQCVEIPAVLKEPAEMRGIRPGYVLKELARDCVREWTDLRRPEHSPQHTRDMESLWLHQAFRPPFSSAVIRLNSWNKDLRQLIVVVTTVPILTV